MRRTRPEVYMFKFSAYPPASFWDKSEEMMLKMSGIPSPQEQGSKTPQDKDKQDQEQGQQVFLVL